jgi:hypothetical protein
LRWLFLYALYLPTRLYALVLLPIFLDETLHARWSLLISEGRKPWWKPWEWGRALTIWIGALVSPWAHDLLWANRLVSVLLGALTLWACAEIGRRLFDARVGFVAGVFYVFCPFTLFYDRLALADACLSALGALTLLFSIRMVAESRASFAILAGVAMALAVYAKAPGVLLFAIPAATGLFLGSGGRPLGPVLLSYAVAIPPAAYALSRFFATPNTARMTQLATENRGSALGRLAANLLEGAGWLLDWWTLPMVALGLLGVAAAVALRRRPGLLLFVLAALPLLAFGSLLSRWLPRYLLGASVPFLVLAAWALCRLLERLTVRLVNPRLRVAFLAVAVLLVLLPALRFDGDLLSEPARAAMPALEREQYILGWTSGYGVRDTEGIIRKELAEHPAGVTVVVHVTRAQSLRATPLALGLAFAREPRVRLEDWDVTDPSAAPALREWATAGPTLLVVPRADSAVPPPAPGDWSRLVVLIARTTKPDGRPCDDVYRFCSGGECEPRS